ncbi:PREDICTED: GATA transcription factor 11 [Tarenaya hassleriana]|uniref:GATA transcription factor 11 n=1 Tax=Tarenaya hassleriana TaxID=28532 RepID=UPI00053C9341|nr:PREDICTED: GATA transcription factor 11 [Tarenaya hassleriana]
MSDIGGFFDGLPDYTFILDEIPEVDWEYLDIPPSPIWQELVSNEVDLPLIDDVLDGPAETKIGPEFLNSGEQLQLEASEQASYDEKNDLKAMKTSSSLTLLEGRDSNSSDFQGLAVAGWQNTVPKRLRGKRRRQQQPQVPSSSCSSSSEPENEFDHMIRMKKHKGKAVAYLLGSEDRTDYICRHCKTTDTPQWREGPSGPKTLCNACGMRFKKGGLCPQYRPATSPTFNPLQHSNYHRKVIQLATNFWKEGGGLPMAFRSYDVEGI